MKKSSIILIIIISSFLLLNAQNYIWPTSVGKYLSSTFGEFRNGHFHSGIDIKTNNKTGYPVYSIDDGYVWRIRTSPFGYGKAVYIRLRDGNIAVYGHLEEFSAGIISFVIAEQAKRERYSTDIILDEYDIPVKRGEVVGYTGDTGTRHPHLHFEIRNSAGQPQNPLKFRYNVADYTIPTIREFAVVPLSDQARINGYPRIQTFPVKYVGKKDFIVKDTIRVRGTVGLELKVHDTVRGLPNKYAPYGIKLIVDDSLIFHTQYDYFDFEITDYIYLDRDLQLIESEEGKFNRLWQYSANANIPFYRSGLDGILDLGEGYHSVKVEAFDFNGNTSTLKAVLYNSQAESPLIQKLDYINSTYKIAVKRDSIREYGNFSADWVSKYGTVEEPANIAVVDTHNDRYILFVSDTDLERKILRLLAKPAGGGKCPPTFINLGSKSGENDPYVELEFIHNPQTMLCILTFSKTPDVFPELFLQSKDSFDKIGLVSDSPMRFIAEPAPYSMWSDAFALEVRIPGSPVKAIRRPVDFRMITRNRGGTISTKRREFVASFNRNSTYDTLLAWIRKDPLPQEKSIIGISPCYTLQPVTQPLDNPINIMISYPVLTEQLSQLGLYRWEEERWDFIESRIDSVNGTAFAEIKRLGKFCMLRDESPPVIKNIFPGDGGRFRSSSVTVIKADVDDDLSGIEDDRSISLYLDDKFLISEYHAVKDYIKYKIDEPLQTGYHRVTIKVHDRAMNLTEQTSSFYILP